MNRLRVFLLFAMAAAGVSAWANVSPEQGAKSAAPASPEMQANAGTRTLDPAIAAQHRRIQSLLAPEAKEKIGRAVPEFREQTRKLKPGTDLRALATAQIRKQFPNLTPRQTDVLAFTLLNETYASLQAAESAGDMSTEQQMQLQQVMEQKSQFETALSNMMKSMSDTSDSIIQNIKS